MKKVIAEICSISSKVNLKRVVHQDDGTKPGYLTVVFTDPNNSEKVRKHIYSKERHLELETLLSRDSNELVYKDPKSTYEILGVDIKHKFDMSGNNKPLPLELLKLIDTFLEEPETL